MPKKTTAPFNKEAIAHPPNKETKRDKFVRLAEKRVSAAILKIIGVGNLANKATYDFSNFDGVEIKDALNDAVDNLGEKFINACNDKPASKADTFKLGDQEIEE